MRDININRQIERASSTNYVNQACRVLKGFRTRFVYIFFWSAKDRNDVSLKVGHCPSWLVYGRPVVSIEIFRSLFGTVKTGSIGLIAWGCKLNGPK